MFLTASTDDDDDNVQITTPSLCTYPNPISQGTTNQRPVVMMVGKNTCAELLDGRSVDFMGKFLPCGGGVPENFRMGISGIEQIERIRLFNPHIDRRGTEEELVNP